MVSRSFRLGHARQGALIASYYSGGGAPALQAETVALLAAMTVQPSAGRQTLIDNLIIALKSAGLWTKCDLFYVLAAHDAQAARINWITPAQVLSVNGTCTFTTDRGYISDGTTGWLGAGVNWNALPTFRVNNGSLSTWCQNEATNANPIIGSSTTNRNSINPRAAAGQVGTRCNTSSQALTAVAASRGQALVQRAASTDYNVYKDGAFLINIVATSAATVAEEVMLLRHLATFNGSHILASAHVGVSLNATEIGQLYSALSTYMTGVGA
jgi:hypothetical protein